MDIKSEFRRSDAWRAALGLLPIPLRDIDVNDRYALLNGSVGNFCLDFVGGTTRDSRASAAWSADVGHYVTLDNDTVLVTRWDKPIAEENYSLKSVLEKIHEFHRHLEKESPSRGGSIVAHVLQVFRQIRSIVSDDVDGKRALQVLLHLLASAAAKTDRISDSPEQWGLTPETLQVTAESISDSRWTSLQLDLRGLGQYEVMSPDVSLILRHASGAVFEEAHRAASLARNLWLPGFEHPATIGARLKGTDSGVFFTPAALARTLAEEALLVLGKPQADSVVIFDPACGSGELLRECLRLLRLGGYDGAVHLIGWDISESATQIARFVLSWEQRSWSNKTVSVQIDTKDSLGTEAWPLNVDLLIMNPPFLAWTKMSSLQKDQVALILGNMQVNRPNLAALFSARAIGSIKPDGVLASIAPNSLLESSSSAPIRRVLSDAFTAKLIGRLGSQSIFADALVDAGIYVGKKERGGSEAPMVLWSDAQPASLSHALRGLRKSHGRDADPILADDFSVYRRSDIGLNASPWIAREYRAWRFFELLTGSRKTVPAKRLFDIQQGVRMGDDAFILPREDYRRLPNEERQFFRPAVMNPSIDQGLLNDGYYIFYPNTRGLPEIEDEAHLLNLVPVFAANVLIPRKEQLIARRSLRNKSRWWQLSEPRSWLEEERPRLISKYFGKDRSFAFDSSGKYVVVVGNGWTLKPEATKSSNFTPEEIYCATLAFVNSSVFGALIRYTSVQVAGGQMDLSNRYIENIPLLAPDKANALIYAELAQLGKLMSTADVSAGESANELILRTVAQFNP